MKEWYLEGTMYPMKMMPLPQHSTRVGKIIDAMTDVERDRLIEAQGWCAKVLMDKDGNRCMLGHAVGSVNDVQIRAEAAGLCRRMGVYRAGDTFDELVARFGMDRIVRAIKLRAAKGNNVTLSEPAEAAVHAG